MKIQVTLISTGGYKPMSTIVDVPEDHYSIARDKAKKLGIVKILAQRHMTMADLRKYGYTSIKMRIAEEG